MAPPVAVIPGLGRQPADLLVLVIRMFFARFGAQLNALCGHRSGMLPDWAIGALNARSFGVALGALLCTAGASAALAAPPSHFVLTSEDARLAVSVPEI